MLHDKMFVPHCKKLIFPRNVHSVNLHFFFFFFQMSTIRALAYFVPLFHTHIDTSSLVTNNFTHIHCRKDGKTDFGNDLQTTSRGARSGWSRGDSKLETQSTRVSCRNTLPVAEMAQQLSMEDTGTDMVHRSVEQRNLFSNAESEYDGMDLSEASDAVGRNTTLVFRGRRGSDASSDNIQIASKLNNTKLEIEKLRWTHTQNKATTMAIIQHRISVGEAGSAFRGRKQPVTAVKRRNLSSLEAATNNSECCKEFIGRGCTQQFH